MGTWIVTGITLGCIYAVVAVGFVVLYKATGILNFAHLSFLLLGAYVTYSFITHLQLSFPIAFLLALIVMAVLGIGIQITFLKHLLGRSIHGAIMICLGLNMIFESLSGSIWGYDNKAFPSPIREALLDILGQKVLTTHLFIVLCTFTLFILLFVFFRFTVIGIQVRAAAGAPESAMLLGIDVNRVHMIVWGLASATGCVAGMLVANLQAMDQTLGHIAIKSFPAMILGGMESVGGAILGGLIVGLVEMATGWYLGQAARDIIPYFLLFFILFIRPYGLFGEEEIDRV